MKCCDGPISCRGGSALRGLFIPTLYYGYSGVWDCFGCAMFCMVECKKKVMENLMPYQLPKDAERVRSCGGNGYVQNVSSVYRN